MRRNPAITRFTIRASLALLAAVLMGGCVSYYERHYGSPGVHVGGYGTSGVYYGSDYGYGERHYRAVNPVYYPYWSIDYFYFSRFHHPYSFYVGYREPLYYPYPGWALDVHFYSPGYSHYRGGLGYGYPWHGYGHFYPRYSLGFFAYSDRSPHRIRGIDRRLRELREPAPPVSRRALIGYGRSDPARGGIPIRSRSSARGRPDGRLEASRGWIRSDTPRRDARERTASSSRLELLRERTESASPAALRGHTTDPGRSSRTNRRQSDHRSAGRSTRTIRAPESRPRNANRSRAALLQRSSAPPPRARTAPPARTRTTPPPRARTAPPARTRTTPPPRSRTAPPPRTRVAPAPRRSSSDGGRSRRELLRERGGGDPRRPRK
jgi:hypothetical protein